MQAGNVYNGKRVWIARAPSDGEHVHLTTTACVYPTGMEKDILHMLKN